MTTLGIILFLFCIFIFSILVTGLIRQYSLRYSLIDIPNERSSHRFPTPRGGGISISFSILISIGLLYYLQLIPFDISIAFVGGGMIVSMIGWLDDHKDISITFRIIGYTMASIWSLYWIGGVESITLGEHVIVLNNVGATLVVLGLVWLTNLYNFMDGTDALAAVQAICTGIMSGILLLCSGQQGLAIFSFVIVTATTGFIFWNWPPAKIFMGDVGSCMIGFSFGLLAMVGENSGSLPMLVWFILLAVFICDATFTLLMRIFKREKWYSAHKSHAYQRYVQMGGSHKRLALSLLLINVMVLWPMAYIAFAWDEFSYYMVVASILLVFVLWGGIQVQYHRTCS